jgi:hypothetical protein
LTAAVVAWALLLSGLTLWSVRHDPPTVPEQRDISRALPVLRKATGAMLAAAEGDGRAVVLGMTRLVRGCRITPVRDGIEATRDVTVYVRADQASAALDTIAAGLPSEYRPDVARFSRGTRVALHADAGGYVSIDVDTEADAQQFTLEASTGCRPTADTAPATADPGPGPEPPPLRDALRVLGLTGTPSTQSISCPGGGTAGTFTVDTVSAPTDLGSALRPAVNGAYIVLADPEAWAYRRDTTSLVVTASDDRLRVSATTPCPA